jgi:TATA-binding protein-associated factor Taf7
MMLTQGESDEEQGGEEGSEGEAAEGEEDDDDDDDDLEGYESPKDPFPRETRRRPMEDELDKDFDLQEEVGIKP